MRKISRLSRFNIASLALGLAFLYLPILILVIYSFNDSRLVTVWGGWSLRWYREFFNDRAMIEAAWMSLRVAVSSATIATLLGTLAAVALSRGERFRGRTLFSGMLYAPLVMPEVITGLSLLLLFVALNAERGFWTVTIAHTTLTMCFVAVVVQSRLGSLDRSLEEAAMDLGCDPVRAFVSVTLPLIAPAIVAGWLLAFTLSLDDLVIASFTTGPGSATLPIRIYSEVRLGVKPEINAICTLVIVLIAVVIVIASLASDAALERVTDLVFQVHSVDAPHPYVLRSIDLVAEKVAPALGWTRASAASPHALDGSKRTRPSQSGAPDAAAQSEAARGADSAAGSSA